MLAVLALNAAWFQDSFLTRQLQGILLLRDGRFLLIGSCEMQGTIDSQLCARVYRCFVSDSLMSLVTFAQDPRSREILRTRVPSSEMEQEKVSPNLNAALQEVKVPRIDYEDKAILEETFGEFKKASNESEGVLFNTLLMDQEELRANIKVGDMVRVKREGATFGWISCQCEGKSPIPQGPVAPDVEEDFVHSSKSQDLRWLSFPGGCHLGLLNGRYYQAKVVRVMDNGSCLGMCSIWTQRNGRTGIPASPTAWAMIDMTATSKLMWTFSDAPYFHPVAGIGPSKKFGTDVVALPRSVATLVVKDPVVALCVHFLRVLRAILPTQVLLRHQPFSSWQMSSRTPCRPMTFDVAFYLKRRTCSQTTRA